MKKLFKPIHGVFLSLKTTIFLLFTIALVSIIGTLIPQQKEAGQYVAQYGLLLYRLFDLLGFFDVYGSWWFRLLLILLLVNLVFCSVSRLPRISTRGNLSKKEWVGRLGPHITHASLIVILAGSLIGNIWGFKGFVNIPQGESIETIALKGSQEMLGLDFTIRCDKFAVSHYPGTETPKEYLSELIVLEKGQEVFKKTIRVNDPLQYRGVTFYQSSYGFLPSRPEERKAELEIIPKGNGSRSSRLQLAEGETKQVQGTDYKVELVALIPDFSLGEGNRIFSRSDQPNNPAVQVNIYQNGKLSYKGWAFLKYPDFHGSRNDTHRVKFINYSGGERPYTGLMVVKDPGIPVVWAGFGLLILGLILSFFLRRRSFQKGGKDD
ncbi:MAG: cytochrome c biogenesis protein ResB [Thermodesulfobacteriota bacterium]|nr:cytochrome c biogenesis protein ResB [Thermodesulfobacteriota bacterium]